MEIIRIPIIYWEDNWCTSPRAAWQREREKTLQILDRIFSATLFLAMQGISLRGHRFESHEDLMLLNAWDFVDGEAVPRDAEDLLVFLQKHNLLAQFESIATLLKLALILSVSSAHDERAFSCLKRVKTYLRSTMTENRLSNLACISINRELVSHISIRELQQPFLNEKTRRIFQWRSNLMMKKWRILFYLLFKSLCA